MWAIRRASIPLKNCNFSTRISIAFSNNSDPPSSSSESSNGNCDSVGGRNHARISVHSDRFCTGRRFLSSEVAGAKISGVNDDDAIIDQNGEENTNEDESHVPDNTDVEDSCENELDSDTETDMAKKEMPTNRLSDRLFKTIMAAPTLSLVHGKIDRWIKEGNEFGKQEYILSMVHLRRRRMYGKALQLSEWFEENKKSDMRERDYASRLDLIAKLHGLYEAEQYMEKIPKSCRGEAVYRSLLASAVAANDRAKAEKIFNKMKDSDFKLTTFVYDQLLLLYKRYDKKRIADVLVMMEKEDLKPTLFTYKILIDSKGHTNDIKGMDQVVETMKEQGIEPDITLQATLVRHYIYTGRKEKAKALLEKIESDTSKNLKEKRWSCRFLLPLYAALGETDDVQRLWKLYESDAGSDLSIAAIEAWGKLKKVEEAEEVFNKLVKAKRVGSKHYSALLKIYAHHKMLSKGRDLVMQMSDSGCPIDPLALDALIKLYIEAGEIQKADAILHKAVEKNRLRPMYNTYMTIMDQYAKMGDIHNTEKIFYRMRQQAGYVSHHRQFQALTAAYVNAKAPFYGVRERMKADNIFPERALAAQLTQVDAFKKTALTELLD